jgi:deazaflavin-dependent oxidoreductase (nitroreductase family)
MSYTRLVQRLGHQRWFAALGRPMVPVDRWIQRVTRGRFTVIGQVGLPSLLLTTTGRRTGEPRTQPLLYAPDGDGYVVVGSNWGQPNHPLWTVNLLANPEASVTVAGAVVPVRATLASGTERDRLWRLLLVQWPAYATYEHRAAGRHLRIFRLSRREVPLDRRAEPGDDVAP